MALSGEIKKFGDFCPICGKDDWCFWIERLEAIVCGRVNPGSEPMGWRYLKDADDGRPIYSCSEQKRKGNGQSVDGILGAKKQIERSLSPSTTPPVLAKITRPLNLISFKSGTNQVTTYYPYSEKQRIIRRDSPNAKKKKEIFPQHLGEGQNSLSSDSPYGLGLDPWPLFNLDQVHEFGSGHWLLWVEGEKCVVIASQFGLLAITAQGSKWGADYLKSEISKLKDFLIAGVCIIPDNDVPGEKKAKAVQSACQSVGIESVLLSRESLYSDLSEGDDIQQIAQKLGDIGVYDYFQNLLIEAVAGKKQSTDKSTETVQTQITEEYIESLPSEAKKEKLTAYDVSDKFKKTYKEKFCYSTKYKSWYEWTGTHWEFIDEEELEEFVHFDMKTIYRPSSPTFYDKVIRFLRRDLRAKGKTNLTKGGYLNFKNGCLDLNTMELITTMPNHWVVSCLPRDYPVMDIESNLLAQLARECPVFWDWSNQAMGNDSQKIMLLLACINAVLTGRFAKFQRFLWLYGVPQSGKGTFTRLLTDLVGKQNTYSTDLNRLDQDSQKAAIFNTQIVFFPDQDKCTAGLGTFKALVGQDDISARRLYKEAFSYTYTGSAVVTSNSPIFYGDRAGLDRRLLLIHFNSPVDFSNRDHDLSEKLSLELDRLTPIALSLPEKLVKDFLLGRDSGEIKDFDAVKWDTQVQSDSLSSWIEDRIIFDPNCSEPVGNAQSSTGHLYANYLEYCAQGKFTPKSLNNFSRDLIVVAQALGHKVEKPRTNAGYKMVGLRLKTKLDFESTQSTQSTQAIQNKPFESTQGIHEVCTESIQQMESTPIIDELSTTSDSEDSCRLQKNSVDLSVDLKPIQDKESVDRVDRVDLLTNNFSSIDQPITRTPVTENVNSNDSPENTSKVEPHNLVTVFPNYSEVEDFVGDSELPILEDEPVTLVTLLVTHWESPQELNKICAQYTDRDFDEVWFKLFSLIDERTDYQVAVKALREIMNARYTYKVVHCPKTLASGTLLNHLTEIFKDCKKRFPALLPDNALCSNLTFAEWAEYFAQVQQAQSSGLQSQNNNPEHLAEHLEPIHSNNPEHPEHHEHPEHLSNTFSSTDQPITPTSTVGEQDQKEKFLAQDILSQLQNCSSAEQMGWIYESGQSDYQIDQRYDKFPSVKQNRISKLRYDYKILRYFDDAVGGKLLGWLIGQLESWRDLGLGHMIPKGLAYNILPVSWWVETFDELDKALAKLLNEPESTIEPTSPVLETSTTPEQVQSVQPIILTENFPKPLPIGAIATFKNWDDQVFEFEIKKSYDLGRIGWVYCDGDKKEINHKFVVKVILPME